VEEAGKMNALTKEQIDFLKKEGTQNKLEPPADYEHLSKDELDRLQEMCCVIEEIEATYHDPITPRGNMAADISDILYNM
jgi:hypothetical protein